MKFTTAEEAVKVIKSNDTVFIHGGAQAPQILITAMVNRSDDLKNVRIVHIHHEVDAPYIKPEYEGIFIVESFFVGRNVREATQEGLADYIPVFLHETQRLIREGYLKVNVALIQVSTPDKFGYVSLGTSVDATLCGRVKASCGSPTRTLALLVTELARRTIESLSSPASQSRA